MATRSVKLFANQQYNYFDPNTGFRLNPGRGAISARGNFATSHYNGLEVGAKRNFSKGIAVYGSYTYSKNLDNGSEVFTTDSAPTSYAANLAPGGRRDDWGNSAYDHRHYGSVTYVWKPAGFHADGHVTDTLLSALTRHWTVSGASRFQSGAYSTVNVVGFDINGDGSNTNDRPFLSNPSMPMSTVGIDGTYVGGATGTYYDMAKSKKKLTRPGTGNQVRWLIPSHQRL